MTLRHRFDEEKVHRRSALRQNVLVLRPQEQVSRMSIASCRYSSLDRDVRRRAGWFATSCHYISSSVGSKSLLVSIGIAFQMAAAVTLR